MGRPGDRSLFAAGAISQLVGAPAPVWWTFYLACYVTGGWEPALSGLQALKEKTLDVDLLMIVAALLRPRSARSSTARC